MASKIGLADAGPFSFAMLSTLFGGLTVALAQVALFSSGVAMATCLYLLTQHATRKVGVYLFTVPLISVLLGVLLLHEPLPPSLALGGAGVLAGVYLSSAEPEQAQVDEAAYGATVAR